MIDPYSFLAGLFAPVAFVVALLGVITLFLCWRDGDWPW